MKFTKHAIKRVRQRGLSFQLAQKAVKQGRKIEQEDGTTIYTYGWYAVVTKGNKVVTVFHHRDGRFDSREEG